MLKNIGAGLGATVATFAVHSLFGDEIENEVKSWFEDEDDIAKIETTELAAIEENQDVKNKKLAKRVGTSVAAGIGAALASRIKR
jgi:hypothetical protein